MPIPTLKIYKGFVLTAAVYAGRTGFLPTLTIRKDHGYQVLEKQITPPFPQNGYATEEEAIEASLHYGASLIDGNLPRQSMNKM